MGKHDKNRSIRDSLSLRYMCYRSVYSHYNPSDTEKNRVLVGDCKQAIIYYRINILYRHSNRLVKLSSFQRWISVNPGLKISPLARVTFADNFL
jgi:hypothetical protein